MTTDLILEDFAKSHPDYDESNSVHLLRYIKSLRYIESQLNSIKANTPYRVLEVGGRHNFFRDLLLEFISLDLLITNTDSDLRYPLDFPDEMFDFIVNMEVLEHIKDQNSDSNSSISQIAEFNYSGLNSLLSECHRVLRRGGRMLMTTPNVSSLDTLHKILLHQRPNIYSPHVREYTVYEINYFLANNGFNIIESTTTDIYFNTPLHTEPGVKDKVIEFARSLGANLSLMGNGIFVIAEKKDASVSIEIQNE